MATELVPLPLLKFCFQGNVLMCIELLYTNYLNVINDKYWVRNPKHKIIYRSF